MARNQTRRNVRVAGRTVSRALRRLGADDLSDLNPRQRQRIIERARTRQAEGGVGGGADEALGREETRISGRTFDRQLDKKGVETVPELTDLARRNAVNRSIRRFPRSVQEPPVPGPDGEPPATPPPGGTPPPSGPGGDSPPSSGVPGNVPPPGSDFNPPQEFPEGTEGIQLGQDPLSEAVVNSLGNLLGSGGGSQTEFGQSMEQALQDLVERGGQLDEDLLAQRLETVEEQLARRGRSSRRQFRSELARRGLINSGVDPESGGTITAERRLAENQDETFAAALRDLAALEQESANERLVSGLSLGTGAAQNQISNLLRATESATGRQRAQDLGALERARLNMDFNFGLADRQLQRELGLDDAQMERIALLLPLIQLLGEGAALSRGGFR